MKRFFFAAISIIIFILGYLLGNFFPLTGFNLFQKTIAGKVKLEVKLMMDNNTPVSNVEVDVGEKPGPPPKGGITYTDNSGVATFFVQPGNYTIYFNTGTFPKNLQMPPLQQILVEEGKSSEKTIVLTAK